MDAIACEAGGIVKSHQLIAHATRQTSMVNAAEACWTRTSSAQQSDEPKGNEMHGKGFPHKEVLVAQGGRRELQQRSIGLNWRPQPPQAATTEIQRALRTCLEQR
jgi:hypothetical protein